MTKKGSVCELKGEDRRTKQGQREKKRTRKRVMKILGTGFTSSEGIIDWG